MKFRSIVVALLITSCGSVLSHAVDAPAPSRDPLIAQGDKYWAAGRLDDARKSFEQAKANNPRSVPAHMKLGGFQLASQKYNDAIQTYQNAISLDANNAKAWIGLGLAYRHTARGELARAAFAEAVRIEPARKSQLAPLLEAGNTVEANSAPHAVNPHAKPSSGRP